MDLNAFLSCGHKAYSRIPPKINAEHPSSLYVYWKIAAIFIVQQEWECCIIKLEQGKHCKKVSVNKHI